MPATPGATLPEHLIEDLTRSSQTELGAAIATSRSDLHSRLNGHVAALGAAHHDLLVTIAEGVRAELFRTEGHRSAVEHVSAVAGVTNWEARRMIRAAEALEGFPRIAAALRSGELSLPKVLDLVRFATPSSEARLVRWAATASPRDVRIRAEKALARDVEDTIEDHENRRLGWWWALGKEALHFAGTLGPEEGSAFIAAVDARAEELPRSPDGNGAPLERPLWEDDPSLERRRLDALVELIASAPTEKAFRPTVVLHAPLGSLASGDGNCWFEDGHVVVPPEIGRGLSCDAPVEIVIEDENGSAVGIGRRSRDVPRWLRRAVLHRDDHVCAFPGCERARYLKMHHIRHWTRGGRTDLDNLVAVCHYHHDLIHRYGWSVILEADRTTPMWFRPGGRRYQPGPAPPEERPRPSPERDAALVAQAAGFSRLFELTRLGFGGSGAELN